MAYTTSAVKLSNDGYKYYCAVSDANGQRVNSNTATLFVGKPVQVPKTGGSSHPLFWLAMIQLLAGVGVAPIGITLIHLLTGLFG